MTRFFSRGYGDLINADRIESITPVKKNESWGSRAILKDGKDVTLQGDLDEIRRLLLPVVAASPGFTLLRFFGPVGVREPDGQRLPDAGEGDPYIEKMPIVAWRIDESHAVPVTPNDSDDDRISNLIGAGVLLPDGQVVMPFDARFDNEEAWLAEMTQRAGSWSKLRVVE
jgi:hypothetical protein